MCCSWLQTVSTELSSLYDNASRKDRSSVANSARISAATWKHEALQQAGNGDCDTAQRFSLCIIFLWSDSGRLRSYAAIYRASPYVNRLFNSTYHGGLPREHKTASPHWSWLPLPWRIMLSAPISNWEWCIIFWSNMVKIPHYIYLYFSWHARNIIKSVQRLYLFDSYPCWEYCLTRWSYYLVERHRDIFGKRHGLTRLKSNSPLLK